MRNRFALLATLSFVFASAALAQTKISGEVQCKAEPPTSVAIPDRPNHSYAIVKATCTWTKPFEMGGSQTKDGSEAISSEIRGNKGSDRGYFAGTMSSGDTFTVAFSGSSRSKDGKPAGSSGFFSFIEGTGKLKGLKGKGRYTGTAGADGTSTFQIEGEYSLP